MISAIYRKRKSTKKEPKISGKENITIEITFGKRGWSEINEQVYLMNTLLKRETE